MFDTEERVIRAKQRADQLVQKEIGELLEGCLRFV